MITETKAVGAAVMLVAVTFIIESMAMPVGTFLMPGPGLVPLVFWGATAITAAIAVAFPGAAAPAGERPPALKVASICLVLGLMILAFERAGFPATVFLGSFLLMRLVERQPLVQSLALSMLLAGGLYLLFDRVLQVTLPQSWLEF